jgi:4'-phosphopantetheinyl transferase
VPVLNQADVHIWYRATDSLDSDAVKLADQHLSIDERIRRDRFRFEADRRDFTTAHDLLRRTLSEYADVAPADWRFDTNKYGKPIIHSGFPQAQTLSFSLSRTRGCVVCAISSNAQLGVDVERIEQSQHASEAADQYFSETESAWLRSSSDEVRSIHFTELWTLKEAYLKAIGVGLSGSLSDISFRLEEHARIEFWAQPTIKTHEWHFAVFEPSYNVRLGIALCSVARPRFFALQDQGDGRTLVPIRTSAPHLDNV